MPATTPSYTYTAVDAHPVFTDFFDIYDVSSEPTSNWTNEWGGTLPSVETENERFGGKVLQYSEAANGERFFSYNSVGDEDVVEMVVGFEAEVNIVDATRFILRGGGGSGTEDGYAFYADPTEFVLAKYVNGTQSDINSVAKATDDDVLYVVRIRVDGTSIKGKIWEEADAEPGSWDLEETDSDLSSGLAGLGYSSQAGNIKFNYFRVGVGVPEGSLPIPYDEIAARERQWTDFSEEDALEQWSAVVSDANEELSIVTDGGAVGGKFLRIERDVSSTTQTYYRYALGQHQDDQDVLIKFKQNSVSNGAQINFWLHSRMESGNEDGYLIELLDDGSCDFIRYINGTPSNISLQSFSRSADTWYWIRIRCVGGVDVRLWADGDQEPTTWDIQSSDTTKPGGGLAIGLDFPSGGTIQFDLDVLSLGCFNTCGVEVDESSLPTAGIVATSAADESVRICDEDGTALYTIAFLFDNAAIRAVAMDTENENLFVSAETGDVIYRFDRYGKYGPISGGQAFISKNGVWGIAINPVANEIYYQENATDDVFKADLDDGGNETTLKLSSGVNAFGVSYDPVDDKVYYSSGSHRRMDTDGSNDEEMIAQTNAIHVVGNGTFFWYTAFSQGTVKRRDIDKTNEIDLYTDLGNPQGLAIDDGNSKIYAADQGNDLIRKSDYDGSNQEDIITGFDNMRQLAFFDFGGVNGEGDTPEYAYEGVDGSSLLGDFSKEADTPEITYTEVDGSAAFGELTVPADTAFYTYEAVDADSNIVSGFADNLGSYEYQGVAGTGILTDTILTFQFPNQHLEYTEFTVDVETTDLTGFNVTAFSCQIAYDQNIITPNQVIPAGLTSGESLTVNLATPGIISVAWAGVSALSGSGTLFQIEFHGEDITDPFEISNLTWNSFQYNEGTPSNTTTNGAVQISSNYSDTPEYTYSVVTPGVIGADTPFITYEGVDGHPVLPGSGIGFGIPPDPIEYQGVDATSSPSAVTFQASTPEFTYMGVAGTGSVEATIGEGETPAYQYQGVVGAGSEAFTATTPFITYTAINATEFTVGEPRHLKLESYPRYSGKITIRPKVFTI